MKKKIYKIVLICLFLGLLLIPICLCKYVLSGNIQTTVYIDKTPPTITVVSGSGSETYNKTKPEIINKAQNVTINTADNIEIDYNKYYYNPDKAEFDGITPKNFDSGTEFTDEGYYKIVAVDTSENKTEIVFLIDKTSPIIIGKSTSKETSSNSEKIEFKGWFNTDIQISEYDKYGIEYTCYKLNATEQKFESISISKEKNSLGAGTNNVWTLTEKGYYLITATDLCGNTSNLLIGLDKQAPTATGITSDKMNEDVLINYSDDLSGVQKAQLAYNTTTNSFTSYSAILNDILLTEDAYYDLYLEDIAGNSRHKTFMIDQTPPVVEGVNDKAVIRGDVTINFYDVLSGIKNAIYYKSNTSDFSSVTGQTFTNNTTFTEDGYYHIIVTDNLDNTTELTFLITSTTDEEPPEIKLSVITKDTGNPTISELESNKTLTGYKLNFKAYDSYSGIAKVEVYLDNSLYKTENWTDEGYYRTGSYSFEFDEIEFYKKGYIIAYDFYNNMLKSNEIIINKDLIWNKNDLNRFALAVNQGDTFENKTIYLMSNIDLENQSFTSIGSSTNRTFKGTFEGNGYTISALNVSKTQNYVGLFGYNNGIIQNINVIGTVTNKGNYTGGIAGYNNNTIQYCISQVKVKTTDNYQYTGGATGYNNGTLYYIFSTNKVEGYQYVGGLAGNNSGTITYSGNFSETIGSNSYIGGIAGLNNGEIDETFNKQKITGQTYVGGITGYNNTNSNISSSYNVKDIKGYDSSASYLGGIAGYNKGILIEDCYNTGDVQEMTYSASIVGYNTAKIQYAYSLNGVSNHLVNYNNSLVLCSCFVNEIQLRNETYIPDGYELVGGFADVLNGCGIIHAHWEANCSGVETGSLGDKYTVDTKNLNPYNSFCLSFENNIIENSINTSSINRLYLIYSNSSDIEVITQSQTLFTTAFILNEDMLGSMENEELIINELASNIELNVGASSPQDENYITSDGYVYIRNYTNMFLTNKSVEINITDDIEVDTAYYYYSTTSNFSGSTRVAFGTHRAFVENGYYKIEAYDTTGNKAVYDYFCINTAYVDSVNPNITISSSSPSSTSSSNATYTISMSATDYESGVKQIDLYLYDEDLSRYYRYRSWSVDSWFQSSKNVSVSVPVSEMPFYSACYAIATDQYGNSNQSAYCYANTSLIYDAYDLKKFSDMSNSSTEYTKVYDKNIYLVNNINLSSVCSSSKGNWSPISLEHKFAGVFNGNYYTIKNLYINSSANRVGLFAGVDVGATIKCFTVQGNVTSSGIYIGGATAVCNGNAEYIKNEVNVTNSYSGEAFIGGIVGCYNYNTSSSVGIKNCWNTGTIKSTASTCRYIGGIAGYAGRSISYCANTGSVITKDSTCAGGIAGALWGGNSSNYPVISYSYNTGNITLTSTSGSNNIWVPADGTVINIGGICGGYNYSNATVKYCYNTGTISSVATHQNQIGSNNVTNSFYLSGKTNDNGKGTALSTTEFLASYTSTSSACYKLNGSTSGTYFRTSSSYNSGYPYLVWQQTFRSNTISANSNANLYVTVGANIDTLEIDNTETTMCSVEDEIEDTEITLELVEECEILEDLYEIISDTENNNLDISTNKQTEEILENELVEDTQINDELL